jgi:hypothetical protein
MIQKTRRDFLKDVGAGAVVASIGPALAADLGFSTAYAQTGAERLTFGNLEPLVSLMQETTAAQLMPQVVRRLAGGTPLRDIVAAAALANARTFGGEDYVGFHTVMAMAPAYHMAQELPEANRALPILKVIYRNATRIQELGGPRGEVLRPVTAATLPAGRAAGEILRDTIRRETGNIAAAEQAFAAMAAAPEDALENLLYEVQDGVDVHRVVLPYRCWDLLGIIGRERAHTLLRQSVRFCVRNETPNIVRYYGNVREQLPRVLDRHGLIGREPGQRAAEDRWVEELSETIFRGTPEQAADAAAAALAAGYAPAVVAEAISLAANQLLLRDNGRPPSQASENKPVGSIHGDSIGVHACDSANAWCNLARVAGWRNKVVCLILGAWQVARDRGDRGGDFLVWAPYPRDDARLEVSSIAPDRLFAALDDAIRSRSQIRAAAITHRYLAANQPARPVWDLFLRYAISEDGALHHEKYYRTTAEEFASARANFRARYLIALARVTASGHGYPAPGHAEARRLLGA